MTCSDGLEAGSKIACCLTIRFLESFVLSLSSLKSMLGRLVAIVAVSLGAAGSANATFVVGDWDPAYGSPFTNLGWRGTTTSFIPAACLGLGPGQGFVANTHPSCVGMSVVSASVEFYALVPYSATPLTVETLTFTGMTVSGIYLDLVTGDLDGVVLTLSGPTPSTSLLAFYGATQADFALRLTFNVNADATFAELLWTGIEANETPAQGGANDTPARVRFSLRTVPEPGSFLLAGAALALAGLARSRRHTR